jgi:hypothetical protein
MKKLAIAIGVLLLVIGITGAGLVYYVYRQVSSTVSQFAELGQVGELERAIRNRATFTPPASLELTDVQVQQLVGVQSAVRRRLGDRWAEFQAKYKSLVEKDTASLSDAPAILNAYRDLAAAWLDAKRSQIDALNDAGLSLDEYRWIRDQAYRALGQPFVDLDIGKLVDEVKRGVTSEDAGRLRGSIGATGPESNRQRLERFRKMLEENLALASFGL